MEFGKSEWRTYEQGTGKEWLLTNGIGGFASSTVIGANTRRYHGLLIASLNPPVKRHLIISNLHESLIIDNETFNLHSFQTPGFTMKGFYHLQGFKKKYLPEFIYNAADVWIVKKIGMVYGQNTVVITYTVRGGSRHAKLNIVPLVNFRDYHNNSARCYMEFSHKVESGKVSLKPYHLDVDIDIYFSEGKFSSWENSWFFNMEYAREKDRGLHATEDHYMPGQLEIEILPYEIKRISIVATCEGKLCTCDGYTLVEEEENRLKSIAEAAGCDDDFMRHLVLAADSFIVHRNSTKAKTIVAGYPWFTDWGRDAMISFAGLTLTTGRYDDAREILCTFSKYVRNGLVPNMFPDEGQEPAYNSADASLWYFEAVNRFIGHTGDYGFVKEYIYAVLKSIIASYMNGTRFDIKMDDDGLIRAGNPNTQITWMDAKIGDYIATPRHGKPVEINALWYNALKVMEKMADKFGDSDEGLYRIVSEKIKKSFIKEFWYAEGGYLYDVIGETRDVSLRPNQLLALRLSYPLINGEKAKSILARVWSKLYTVYGLRTLSPDSPGYRGVYFGPQSERDLAYHQGTVWPWLTGPFVDSIANTYGLTENVRELIGHVLSRFKSHLFNDACIGFISEIFDGNDPQYPRGCIAQAWSVGEVLRTYWKYVYATQQHKEENNP